MGIVSSRPPHEPPPETEASGDAPPRRESLAALLGGRKGAIDASLPPVAFVVGWLASGSSIGWGAASAIALSVVMGGFRLVRGDRIRAVLISLAAVVLAALIALRTGRAQDFFLIQLMSNVASALAWAVSIVIRWPLLGVVVGTVLGQKTRWRSDPDLLRAYSRASWVWVFGQYTVRVAVFGALWWAGEVVALGVARTALSWPLVALTVAVSGWVLHRSLPADHPGLRHPVPQARAETESSGTEQSGTEQSGTEQPRTEQSGAEQSSTEPSDTAQPSGTGLPGRDGETPTDQARAGQAAADTDAQDAGATDRGEPESSDRDPASYGGANA